MAKKQETSSQPFPSKEANSNGKTVERIELVTEEITNRAFATTTVLAEILARGDDRRYVTHWGINE
jgi:hypothetical protein